MRRLAILSACAAAAGLPAALPSPAFAGQCGTPDVAPIRAEFADGSVRFRREIFGRPGIVAATDGVAGARDMRALGATTIFWEMNLPEYVGTPGSPRSAASIPAAAQALFDEAVESSQCGTPLIVLNELLGASSPRVSGAAARYRQNVLALTSQLSALGARPFVLTTTRINFGPGVAAFWRQLATVADIVPEIYFNGKQLYAMGALKASRTVRIEFRRVTGGLIALGIPPTRIGIMLGFQTTPGQAGREGLQPLSSWLQVVKWQALAAEVVAKDNGIGSIWSWGWGTFTSGAPGDPDKPAAACVWLWTRDQSLCDAPARAAFNTDLNEGQLFLRPGVQCSYPGGVMTPQDLARQTKLVRGDRATALSSLLQTQVTRRGVRVRGASVTRALKEIVARRYRGNARRLRLALKKKKISKRTARGIVRDQLARQTIGRRGSGGTPETRYAAWLKSAEQKALDGMLCVKDEMPAAVDVDLGKRFSFLRPPPPRARRPTRRAS